MKGDAYVLFLNKLNEVKYNKINKRKEVTVWKKILLEMSFSNCCNIGRYIFEFEDPVITFKKGINNKYEKGALPYLYILFAR